MQLASSLPVPDVSRRPIGRRALALLVVILVHILLVVILLLLAPPKPPGNGDKAKVFTLSEIAADKPKPVKAPSPKPRTKGAPPATAKTPTPPVKAPTPPPTPFGTQLFEAVDIAKLPNHKAELATGQGTADSGAGPDHDTEFTEGGAPGGERLYKAEWQREPTEQELNFYVPRSGVPADSWAVIACKTADRFRVEDCQQVDEYPRGSGLARAMTNAAWQFRVRPPRVGGKALIGAWVGIHIGWTKRGGDDQ